MKDWADYEAKFRAKSIESGHDEAYITRCLAYARPLYDRHLPIIYDELHLSRLVGYKLSYLIGATQRTQHYYRVFSVAKKAGGERQIAEPLPSLKEIQRWILNNILYRVAPSRYAKGFVPKRSIKENARFHKNQEKVLSLDLKDFFTSIKSIRVFSFFYDLGYRRPVADLLAGLCTLDGVLPQGAPTSPALSNLINIQLDKRLGSYARKHNLRYTRYADDITFSGKVYPGRTILLVQRVASESGLQLNEKKTRLMERHQRQEVTGITVNQKMQASRLLRRELRQAIYYIKRYGLDSHLNHTQNYRANYIEHVMGIANFILFVNPKDREAEQALGVLKELQAKLTPH
jgi:RNA-directed DNA polymerase